MLLTIRKHDLYLDPDDIVTIRATVAEAQPGLYARMRNNELVSLTPDQVDWIQEVTYGPLAIHRPDPDWREYREDWRERAFAERERQHAAFYTESGFARPQDDEQVKITLWQTQAESGESTAPIEPAVIPLEITAFENREIPMPEPDPMMDLRDIGVSQLASRRFRQAGIQKAHQALDRGMDALLDGQIEPLYVGQVFAALVRQGFVLPKQHQAWFDDWNVS